MSVAYVGLGSNLGDPERNLERAIELLVGPCRVRRCSTRRLTAPVGFEPQPEFLNAVVEIETELGPEELLRRLQAIERELGRRPAPRYGPRVIDLDLLFYDELVLDTPELRLPHPRLHERRFVLEPLAELAPELVHPELRRTVAELLRELA